MFATRNSILTIVKAILLAKIALTDKKNGEPPVNYKHPSEWEMRKLVESKKKDTKKKPIRGGYSYHTCIVCGQEFVATHNAQKICSYECRKERDRRYWHERKKREKANDKRGQNE